MCPPWAGWVASCLGVLAEVGVLDDASGSTSRSFLGGLISPRSVQWFAVDMALSWVPESDDEYGGLM